MNNILYWLIISIFLGACHNVQYPIKAKTRYEYRYSFKPDIFDKTESSKWRKSKRLIEYIKYDEKGNEIEIGEFGERWAKKVETSDDSIINVIWYHGIYPKKLKSVLYKSYNDSNQLIAEELWKFRDNKKDYLVYKTIFQYIDGKLKKEEEYDQTGKLIREKEFDPVANVITNNKMKTLYEPFVRINGKSIDSIKYDTTGREVEKIHYFDGKFLRRTVIIYNDQNSIITTYKYDDKPDSLWSFTEIRYDYFTKQPIRKYWKVFNCTTETKVIYKYNRHNLLKRTNNYNVDLFSGNDELVDFTKYKYKLY